MEFQGRVALVTGGGTGIGRATALSFAEHGAAVSIAGRRARACEEAAAEIKRMNGRAIAVGADVSVDADVRMMIRKTVEEFGRLDIVFNNAGIGHDTGVLDTSEDIWDHVVDINLKGVFLGCKHSIAFMKANGGGSIINSGSTAGLVGFANRAAYCASKGGVLALTRALAVECLSYGIRINAICPGATDTAMAQQSYLKAPDPEAARQRHIQRQPVGRLSRPEEIAAGVLFLASAPTTMTGSCLVIDGGYTVV